MSRCPWAVKKTSHSKSIHCTYSETHEKKDRKHADLSKSLNQLWSQSTNAPLSYVTVLWPIVRIKHWRSLASSTMWRLPMSTFTIHVRWQPSLQKLGGLQPDLNGLNDIMSLLQEKPMLQSDVLRPLLTKYLPFFYKATDAQFIANFRIWAQHWIVANGDKEINRNEARFLASKRPFASEEFLLSDNPI